MFKNEYNWYFHFVLKRLQALIDESPLVMVILKWTANIQFHIIENGTFMFAVRISNNCPVVYPETIANQLWFPVPEGTNSPDSQQAEVSLSKYYFNIIRGSMCIVNKQLVVVQFHIGVETDDARQTCKKVNRK